MYEKLQTNEAKKYATLTQKSNENELNETLENIDFDITCIRKKILPQTFELLSKKYNKECDLDISDITSYTSHNLTDKKRMEIVKELTILQKEYGNMLHVCYVCVVFYILLFYMYV